MIVLNTRLCCTKKDCATRRGNEQMRCEETGAAQYWKQECMRERRMCLLGHRFDGNHMGHSTARAQDVPEPPPLLQFVALCDGRHGRHRRPLRCFVRPRPAWGPGALPLGLGDSIVPWLPRWTCASLPVPGDLPPSIPSAAGAGCPRWGHMLLWQKDSIVAAHCEI